MVKLFNMKQLLLITTIFITLLANAGGNEKVYSKYAQFYGIGAGYVISDSQGNLTSAPINFVEFSDTIRGNGNIATNYFLDSLYNVILNSLTNYVPYEGADSTINLNGQDLDNVGSGSFNGDISANSGIVNILSTAPRLRFTETGEVNEWTIIQDGDALNFRANYLSGTKLKLKNDLVNLYTDLEVNGTITGDEGLSPTDMLQKQQIETLLSSKMSFSDTIRGYGNIATNFFVDSLYNVISNSWTNSVAFDITAADTTRWGNQTLDDILANGNTSTKSIQASSFNAGGTSSQFLKADGSLDNNTYLTTSIASSTYEPIFSKNTAFNKNFGTTSGTAAQGNDSRFHSAVTLNATSYNYLSLSGQEITLEAIDYDTDITNKPTQTQFADKEVPSGLINSINTSYTLANTPTTGSDHVFLNGILQDDSSDYGITGAVITFTIAPKTGDKLVVTYRY